MVEDFQRSFGNYPTGSLVELSTGEVGYVIQQNPRARLQPRVYLMLDRDKNRRHGFFIVDLANAQGKHADAHICACLKTGSYDLDT